MTAALMSFLGPDSIDMESAALWTSGNRFSLVQHIFYMQTHTYRGLLRMSRERE